LGRFAFAARQITAESRANSNVAQPIEIPDPMTLVETVENAGLSLEWLLYGVRHHDTAQTMPKRLKTNHPPPVNLVLQRDFVRGAITQSMPRIMCNAAAPSCPV